MEPQQDSAPVLDAIDEVTYWASVWEQFKKNRIAYSAMWGTVGLVMLAVFAPALVLERPFYIHYTDAGGNAVTEFPWFWSLFDRLLFENGVDIFFNIVMFNNARIELKNIYLSCCFPNTVDALFALFFSWRLWFVWLKFLNN